MMLVVVVVVVIVVRDCGSDGGCESGSDNEFVQRW